MAYSQTKKDTIERKLQALRAQLYGKEALQEKTLISKPAPSGTFKFSSHGAAEKTSSVYPASAVEVNFLKKDLLKILSLASLAIGGQIIFYFMFVVRGS